MSGLDWEKANRRESVDPQFLSARESRRRARESQRAGLGPTPKQLRYLKALAAQVGREPPDVNTRDGASAAIGELKRQLECATRARATSTAKGPTALSLDNSASDEQQRAGRK